MPNRRGTEPNNLLRKNIRKHFEPFFKVLIAAFTIGLVISFHRIHALGFSFYWLAQSLMIVVTLGLLLNHHRFRLKVLTSIILAMIYLMSVIGLARLGLAAGSFLVLFVIPMFLVALISFRAAIWSLIAIAVTILALGVLHATEIIVPVMNVSAFNSHWGHWLFFAFLFSVSAYAAVYVTHMLRSYWTESYTKLKQSHEEVQALIDYSPGGILIYDLNLEQFTSANPTAGEQFGADPQELLQGQTYDDLFSDLSDYSDPKAMTLKDYVQAAYEGETNLVEAELLPLSGPPLSVDLTISHLPIPDRDVVRLTSVDNSRRKFAELERQSLEAQLAQSQRLEAVGKLSGGVAHDFNNLLAVILGNVEFLREETTNPEHITMLNAIANSVQRGSDLTQNMLSFARRARLTPQEVKLNDVVRNIENWAGRTLPANVDVEVSLLAGLWSIEADPSALQNAILNLLINARDAMPEGGKLAIETANLRIDDDYIFERSEEVPPGRYVMLAISDTGAGIPVEIVERIFEPFFSTKPVGQGTGLGLSMVLGFMRQSGGTIRVYSEPNEGTTFKLYFPISAGAAKDLPAAGATVAERKKPLLSGETVLVVEDEDELLHLLEATLTKAGYNVITASSGDEAFDKFKTFPHIDLLLTDIVMPGSLQGTSLSKALREIDPKLPAVFMSGYASEATVHGNGLRPEDIRLMKPVTRQALLSALEQALAHAKGHTNA